MDITPGMWALIGAVVVLAALHVCVYMTLTKLKQRIKDLEDRQK